MRCWRRCRRRCAPARWRRSTHSPKRRPRGAEALAEHERTHEFAWIRALAIEAYYSDFVAPGRDAAGAWAEIGFDPPVARRLRKDWSWLGVE